MDKRVGEEGGGVGGMDKTEMGEEFYPVTKRNDIVLVYVCGGGSKNSVGKNIKF